MNNFFLTITIFLFSTSNTVSQITFEIFRDDSLHIYFNELGREHGYFYNHENLKDSLPDGTYIFYNVKRKDSLVNHKNVWIIGHYYNLSKSGKFVTSSYTYRKRKYVLDSRHISHYEKGKKNGIEIKYNSYEIGRFPVKIMSIYAEYSEGKKDGLFMSFELGKLRQVYIFENDTIKDVLFDILVNNPF